MKKLCLPVNQVLEQTFSNHVFEIDVDSIEKFIHCFLQGGPFGGPARPPVSSYIQIHVAKYELSRKIFLLVGEFFCLKVAHPATTHYNLLDAKPRCNGEFWFHFYCTLRFLYLS